VRMDGWLLHTARAARCLVEKIVSIERAASPLSSYSSMLRRHDSVASRHSCSPYVIYLGRGTKWGKRRVARCLKHHLARLKAGAALKLRRPPALTIGL
jgi:hypothetical protein